MEANVNWLAHKISEFISIVEGCRDATAFDHDRELYNRDIEVARKWLDQLRDEGTYEEISDFILSPYSAKYFGDYWKQPPCGDIEMEALESLRSDIAKSE